MTSKEISERLSKMGYTLITPSLYYNEDKTYIIFNAYDKMFGDCTKFFIDMENKTALYQNLSAVLVLNTHSCDKYFF